MRIGIDGRFVQGQNTGVTNYVVNLLRGIDKIDRNNDYNVFLSDHSYKNRIPVSSNFQVKINSVNPLIWKNIWLPAKCRKLKIELMHFPAYTASFIKAGKRNIVTIPDVIHKVNPNWFSRKELILLDLPISFAIKNSDVLIAISENTKKDIIKYYNVPEEKIFVTPLAVDESFKPIEQPSLYEYLKNKYSIDCEFILNVGVLFKRRNIPRLLEAFSILKKNKKIKHKLVIIGPGKKYFNLNDYIDRYKLKQDVIYLGYVEQADMPLMYNAASFFIYPSLYEGFGLPVLEAMSCAKAVITSNASSLPEVLGDGGISVDPYNIGELYDAMFRLIEDIQLRKRMEMRALELSKSFSWEQTAKQTIWIYEKNCF